jgi:hypothetical protein
MKGHWRPYQSTSSSGLRPHVGDIIASEFAGWRVVDITDVLPLDPQAQQYIIGVRKLVGGEESGKRHILTVTEQPAPDPSIYREGYLDENPERRRGRSPSFNLLPEHYSICAKCGDVQPCREVYNDAQVDYALDELKKYDDPSVCPACSEVITLRQKTLQLPNVVSPAGGTVTYHSGRWRCVRAAADYEKRVLAAGAIDHLTMSCTGRLIEHVDRTLECLDLDCPGTEAQHGSFEHCRSRSHGCPRLECSLGVA